MAFNSNNNTNAHNDDNGNNNHFGKGKEREDTTIAFDDKKPANSIRTATLIFDGEDFPVNGMATLVFDGARTATLIFDGENLPANGTNRSMPIFRVKLLSNNKAANESLNREVHTAGVDARMLVVNPLSKQSIPSEQSQDTSQSHNAVSNPHQPIYGPQNYGISAHKVGDAQQDDLKRKFYVSEGDQIARDIPIRRFGSTNYQVQPQDAPKLYNTPYYQSITRPRSRSDCTPAMPNYAQQYGPQSESHIRKDVRLELPLHVWKQYQLHSEGSNPIGYRGLLGHGYLEGASGFGNATSTHSGSQIHGAPARKMFVNSNAQQNDTKGYFYTEKHLPGGPDPIIYRGQVDHGESLKHQDASKLDNATHNPGYHLSSVPRSDSPSAPDDGQLPLNSTTWRNHPIPETTRKVLKVSPKVQNRRIGRTNGDIKSAMILGYSSNSSYSYPNRPPPLSPRTNRLLQSQGSQRSTTVNDLDGFPPTTTPVPSQSASHHPVAQPQTATASVISMSDLDDPEDVPGLYKKIGSNMWRCTYNVKGRPCSVETSAKRRRDRHIGSHAKWEERLIDAQKLKPEEAIALSRRKTMVYECDVPDCGYFLEKNKRYRVQDHRVDHQKAAHIRKYHPSGEGGGPNASLRKEKE